MPDVEIDIDDLLDADSEEERASKLQVKSFQYLEFSDHRCLGLLGFPKPGGDTVPRHHKNNGILHDKERALVLVLHLLLHV